MEILSYDQVIHEVAVEPVPPGQVIAGCGVTLAVGIVLPGQEKSPLGDVDHYIPRMNRDVVQLLPV